MGLVTTGYVTFYVHIYLTRLSNILRTFYNGHSNHDSSSYVSCHMLILYETTPLRIVCKLDKDVSPIILATPKA